jgi:N-acetyl-gamma-glutamylphosphate reductase
MATKTIQAVIFGATGLAGSGVLDECIKHPGVTRVTIVSRRSSGKEHDKLSEIIHQNFLDYSSIENSLDGHNACF